MRSFCCHTSIKKTKLKFRDQNYSADIEKPSFYIECPPKHRLVCSVDLSNAAVARAVVVRISLIANF